MRRDPPGRRRAGFTLVELIAVITVLGVLALVAAPAYFDQGTHARYTTVEATIGALRTGIGSAHMAMSIGTDGGSLPDANQNNYPDDLGDTVVTEPTLFDHVLQEPVANARGKGIGWKPYEVAPFPVGVTYIYYFDVDGNETYNAGGGWNEPVIVWDGAAFTYLPDSRAP